MKPNRMKNNKFKPHKTAKSINQNCVDIARADDIVFLKIFGLGNAGMAVTMRDLVEVYIQNGCYHIIFDLSSCSGLDSTFMGTIMALALAVKDKRYIDEMNQKISMPPVVLANIHANAMKQITMLGLTRVPDLIYVKKEPVIFPQTTIKKIRDDVVDKEKRLKTIISAHKELMKIDIKNQQIFTPFLKAVIQEIENKLSKDN